MELNEHKHTNECLQYAAKTGKAYCIANCADSYSQFKAKNKRLREYAVHKADCDLNMSVEKIIETSSAVLWCTCGFGLIGEFGKEK